MRLASALTTTPAGCPALVVTAAGLVLLLFPAAGAAWPRPGGTGRHRDA